MISLGIRNETVSGENMVSTKNLYAVSGGFSVNPGIDNLHTIIASGDLGP